jgi:hypothetical protein
MTYFKRSVRLVRRHVIPALAATTIVMVSAPQRVAAQQAGARALTGKLLGAAHLQVSAPRGEFGENTGNGFGLGVSMVWRMEETGIANARADLGFLTYGRSTRRIPLANSGGLVKLDLTTSSNIASFVVGPQLFGSTGAVSPYVSALGGFSVFWTESSVEGSNNDNTPFASTTNSSDAVWAYGGSAGIAIRVVEGERPFRIDGGVRYLRHDDAKYLTNDRVQEAFQNDRDPIPVRGRADFFTYYIGVNAVVF